MAIFTAIGGLIAGAIGLGSATLFGVSVGSLIGGALAFGTQLAISYLTRPKKRTYSAVQGQREYGARVPAWALYGKGKVTGHHIFYAKWGSGNKFNADVFILANGWCDGLEEEIYFYGEKHTLVSRTIIDNEVAHYGVDGFDDLISIRFYDGRPGQGVDTKLVTDTASLGQEWKSTSVCAGLCYVVVERKWSAEKFDKGQPEFEFVLRGLRLYDPRKDSTVAGGSGSHRLDNAATWQFSQNPALERLNYQLGLRGLVSGRTIIGEGKSLGQLDLGSYFAAMNVCDTIREGKPTFQASLLVTSDDDHTEILKEFDDAMAGYGMNRRGLSGVIPGAPQVPVASVGPDDLDMGRPKQIKLRKSAFELYNHMSGQFTSPEANWNPQSLDPVYVNLDVAADGRVRQVANDFLQVIDPDIAEYLLQIRYRQNRKGGSATIPVSRRLGFKVMEGEWITYADRTWLITGWNCDEELRVTLTLAETGPDVYSSDGIAPGPIVVPSPSPINPSLLSTVQNFAVQGGYITNDDGHQVPTVYATWDAPEDPTITQVRFEYLIDDGNGGASETTLLRDAMDDPEEGEHYITKGVMELKPYAVRATITTVPDRLKTYTPWVTTALPTGAMLVAMKLAAAQDDIRNLLKNLADQREEIRELVEQLAMDVAIGQGKQIQQHSAVVKTARATAAAFLQLEAEVNDDETGLSALASAILGVQANVDNLSAGGLISFKVELPPPAGILAQINVLARASTEDDFIESGLVIQVLLVGGILRSRVVILTDQFIVSDGTATALPMVFEDGVLYLDDLKVRWADIASLVAGNFVAQTANIANAAITSAKIGNLTVETGNIAAGAITNADDDTFTGAIPSDDWETVASATVTSPSSNPIFLGYTVQLFGQAPGSSGGGGSTPFVGIAARIVHNGTPIASLEWASVGNGQSATANVNESGVFLSPAKTTGNNTIAIQVLREISGIGGGTANVTVAQIVAQCNKK